MIDKMEYVELAHQIAKRAHAVQVDKGGRPYIEHPEFVADHVEGWKAKCVAYLHDVIEDTRYTAADLLKEGIPKDVVAITLILTRDKNEDYFKYIKRVKKNKIAREVKLADLTHNSIAERWPQPLSDDAIAHLEKYKKALEILKE